MIVGAIGDDFTGSSDLGLMLSAGGMRTVQYVGVPEEAAAHDVDAGIVALKTRSVPVAEAVAQSRAALRWLKAQGARTILFKYCSTFDSTREGNIGPVIDALRAELGDKGAVIVCPAFPATGRRVFMGHLFVNDRLLSESGMENHPLTPMTDPDIRRWLGYQTACGVGHLSLSALRSGKGDATLAAEAAAGRPLVVCDAIEDSDLFALGALAANVNLITGGSGIALGIPQTLGFSAATAPAWRGEAARPALCLSGSCSAMTRRQIEAHRIAGGAQRLLNVEDVVEGRTDFDALIEWASKASGLPLIYSSDDPAQVLAWQQRYGTGRVASAVEDAFGTLARLAVAAGIGRLISAGGETSGAVVGALGIDTLEIGPAIDPGVPALRATGRDLVIALKSGNFGAQDFFYKAAKVLAA
ncbi:3-oxo-tetronate kinase [Roseicitreum antarcticum]|uniref:3-oxo-tetronate kinase n=1 Tax=Roseicitreum antarcticum TaxID=564137 RepID=A0A1H2U107_9RHOB|nr:3-oxo-tetronate kinase [Roseicitreum antarcticum]SDW49677.1 Uncharacterized conserved protein YgbK, DUF1537 family [Roseicitreum antarcticum]